MSVHQTFRVLTLQARGRFTSSYNIEDIVKKLPLGDFFLFRTIARNVDSLAYKKLLQGLSDQLETTECAPEPSPPTFKKLSMELQQDETLQLKKKWKDEDSSV